MVGKRDGFGSAARVLAATVAIGWAMLSPAGVRAVEETKVIKIATLAPEGSSWMKLIHDWALAIEKRAPGLKFKFFAGGVAGDERDAVRKMKIGQINGAAVTAIGLGLIQPEVRAFELPFIFKDEEEMHTVRKILDADLRKLFMDKGYVLLNWGDIGPVHVFSNIPLLKKEDLTKIKLWEWTDDPLVKALFTQLGMKGVSLGVPDVLPSLQTGLIDACYGSALSTLALQWNTKVKYMTSMTISQSVGAQVITRAAWDGLGVENQKIVMDESTKLGERLKKQVHDDNGRALEKMKSLGLVVTATPPEVQSAFEEQGRAVAGQLDGKVYTAEFRARLNQLIADHRAGKK